VRGEHPKSRANLTGPPRESFVWKFDGKDWSKVDGPMAFGRAYAKATKLGKADTTATYVASGERKN
jgi:hypothetical protein